MSSNMVARHFAHTIAQNAAAGIFLTKWRDGTAAGFQQILKVVCDTNSEQKTKRITNKSERIMMNSKPITDKRTEYGNILRKHRSLN